MDKYLKQLADLDVVIYVNNVSNLKSKIEQSMKALDLQDLQLVLEFAGNLAKFKKQEILAAYNRLDKGDQAVPTDRLLCLNGGRSEFFKYLEDAMGHELSDEEKFVVLLKLLKHQKTREVADKIPKKVEKWQIQ